jgi:hypothetical protein
MDAPAAPLPILWQQLALPRQGTKLDKQIPWCSILDGWLPVSSSGIVVWSVLFTSYLFHPQAKITVLLCDCLPLTQSWGDRALSKSSVFIYFAKKKVCTIDIYITPSCEHQISLFLLSHSGSYAWGICTWPTIHSAIGLIHSRCMAKFSCLQQYFSPTVFISKSLQICKLLMGTWPLQDTQTPLQLVVT